MIYRCELCGRPLRNDTRIVMPTRAWERVKRYHEKCHGIVRKREHDDRWNRIQRVYRATQKAFSKR